MLFTGIEIHVVFNDFENKSGSCLTNKIDLNIHEEQKLMVSIIYDKKGNKLLHYLTIELNTLGCVLI